MGCVEGGEIVEGRPGADGGAAVRLYEVDRLGVAKVQKIQRAHEVRPCSTVTTKCDQRWPKTAYNHSDKRVSTSARAVGYAAKSFRMNSGMVDAEGIEPSTCRLRVDGYGMESSMLMLLLQSECARSVPDVMTLVMPEQPWPQQRSAC